MSEPTFKEVLRAKGYDVRPTPERNGRGARLIVRIADELVIGEMTVSQARRWIGTDPPLENGDEQPLERDLPPVCDDPLLADDTCEDLETQLDLLLAEDPR